MSAPNGPDHAVLLGAWPGDPAPSGVRAFAEELGVRPEFLCWLALRRVRRDPVRLVAGLVVVGGRPVAYPVAVTVRELLRTGHLEVVDAVQITWSGAALGAALPGEAAMSNDHEKKDPYPGDGHDPGRPVPKEPDPNKHEKR